MKRQVRQHLAQRHLLLFLIHRVHYAWPLVVSHPIAFASIQSRTEPLMAQLELLDAPKRLVEPRDAQSLIFIETG